MAKKESKLAGLERRYPGARDQLRHFEDAVLPTCRMCGSAKTADVQVGVVGRIIAIASLTNKVKLVPNGSKRGNYYCNGCGEFFD